MNEGATLSASIKVFLCHLGTHFNTLNGSTRLFRKDHMIHTVASCLDLLERLFLNLNLDFNTNLRFWNILFGEAKGVVTTNTCLSAFFV